MAQTEHNQKHTRRNRQKIVPLPPGPLDSPCMRKSFARRPILTSTTPHSLRQGWMPLHSTNPAKLRHYRESQSLDTWGLFCETRTCCQSGLRQMQCPCRSGGIGRRAWFRSMYSQGCGGSSPLFGTKVYAMPKCPDQLGALLRLWPVECSEPVRVCGNLY